MPTLAEQVAALEAERDEWRTAWEGVNTHRNQLRDALAAAESRLASARVEGALNVQTRLVGAFTDGATWLLSRQGANTSAILIAQCEAADEAARRYPAPAAPAGEQTRPAPTPEPKRSVSSGISEKNGIAQSAEPELWFETQHGVLFLNALQCRRIVALGSRPTQTAEG